MILEQNYQRRKWYIVPIEARWGSCDKGGLKWSNPIVYKWIVDNVHNSAWTVGHVPMSKTNKEMIKMLGLPINRIHWIRFVKYTDAVNFLFSQADFG